MEMIPLETVVSMIRERRERIHRHSLISIDDDEVATYQIEITTDSSVGSSLPPRFSLSGNEEYLAEFDFVQAEEDEKEPIAVHYEAMPVEKDNNAKDDMTMTDSFRVESAPVTEKKEEKEYFFDPIARFSSLRCRKQKKGTIQAVKKTSSFDDVEVPVEPLASFSPFRKKKRAKETGKSGSVHDGVVVAVAPVAPVAGFSPFRKKTRWNPQPAKSPSVSYFRASIEPEAKSTPPPPGKNKRFGIKLSASFESAVSASSALSASSFGSKRSGAKYLAASTEPATESTQGKKPPSVLSAFPFEPTTESTPVRNNEDVNESIHSDAEPTPVRENEDSKESLQLDAKSMPVKTEKDATQSFVVGENVDVKPKAVKEDKDLVAADLDRVSTPVKKSKHDDDTESTTASSDSGRSPTKTPIASHHRRGTNQKATVEWSLFDRYLEKALDKIGGSCNCTAPTTLKRIARKCDPVLEEDEAMKLSVENILADKFQRSKQKAQERKALKKADKKAETKADKKAEKEGAETKAEKKTEEKKSNHTAKLARAFAPVCAQATQMKEPPTVEWGRKPSEDESDFSSVAKAFTVSDSLQKRVSRLIWETNHEDADGKEMDGEGVGVSLQKKVSRFLSFQTKDGDAGEKEVHATVEDREPISVGDAVLSVTPVRMNKKEKVVEHLSDERGNERNEVGPDDVSYDTLFDDIDCRSGSDADIAGDSEGDSEYTTKLVRVDFDPSKLWDTTDADKFLAREVLRRYAEMTGVSLDELIEEVVDESMASITLDTFPMER